MHTENNLSTIIQYFITHNITISSAESCSGGLISKMITDIPGCSAIYPGGVCAYSNEMKIKWLNVKSSTLEQYGAVSAETALEMAQGIRNVTGSDYGISTTGIAGPGGGSAEKPVGLVYIGISYKDNTRFIKLNLFGSRSKIREMAACYAINEVRKTILGGINNG